MVELLLFEVLLTKEGWSEAVAAEKPLKRHWNSNDGHFNLHGNEVMACKFCAGNMVNDE